MLSKLWVSETCRISLRDILLTAQMAAGEKGHELDIGTHGERVKSNAVMYRGMTSGLKP